MSGFVAVTLREVVERRAVLMAAAAAALIPLLLPLLPGNPTTVDEARDVSAWGVATLVTLGFGLMVGATTFAGDLVGGRLGFYLARPVSTLALWAGKMAGSLLLVVGSAALILAVPLVLGLSRPPVGPGWADLGWSLVSLVLVAVLSIAGAHALAVMWRVRSRWLVLDLVATLAAGAGAWFAVKTLLSVHAWDLLIPFSAGLLVLAGLACLVAGGVGLARGRSELPRTHRALSLTLWSLVALAVVAANGAARWVAAPSAEDFTELRYVTPAPAGPWVAFTAHGRNRGDHMRLGVLLHTESGRLVRFQIYPWQGPSVMFSRSGRHAVIWRSMAGWSSGHDGDDLVELDLVDLEARSPRLRSTGLALPVRWTRAMALDPTGQRIAAIADGLLAVYPLQPSESQITVPLPAATTGAQSYAIPVWVTPDRIKIVGASTPSPSTSRDSDPVVWELVIAELDLATRRLKITGSNTTKARILWPRRLNLEADRLLVWGGGRVFLHNARTAELLLARSGQVEDAALVRDGSLVTASVVDGRGVLIVQSDDSDTREIDLGPAGTVRLGGEVATDVVTVGVAAHEPLTASGAATLAVHLATGDRTTIAEQRVPASQLDWALQTTAAPGSLSGRLLDGGDVLEVHDPTTGERRIVAGRP